MTNKSTKKALLLSVLSMLLCVAMLVGTTFAWFTDSVTSGKNTIKAGNLDIALDYLTKDGKWETVEKATDLLDPNALWEPGHAEVVYLKISNLGTLALKYQFSMNIFKEVVGESVLGNEIHLSDYLMYGVVDYTDEFETRDEAIAAVADKAVKLDDYVVTGEMEANDPAKTVALVVYMPTTVGNEANYRGETVPSVELGVELLATQKVSEDDFFDNKYDEDATIAKLVYTFDEFKNAIADAIDGSIIALAADMEDVDGILITDKNITIDLNGNSLTVSDGATTGNRVFKITGSSNVTIKNGTLVAEGNTNSGAYGTVRTEDTANVTLDNVKMYNYRGNGLNVKALAGTSVTLNNCYIESVYGGGVEAAGGIVELNNVTINQKGMWTAPYNSMAVSVNGGGKATINGGTYTTECLTAEEAYNQGSSHGPWTIGVLNSGGTLVVNDGTFSNDNFGDNSLAKNARGLVFADTGAVVEINGGTFKALKNVIDIQNNLGDASKNPSITFAGGTYSANPTTSNYSHLIKLADGYEVVENDADGTWTVERKYNKVTATGDKAENGEALADAINNGETPYIMLSDGEYKMPSIAGNKEFTICGTEDTIIDLTWGAYMDSAKVSFEGVTIKGSTGKANGNGSDYAALYTYNVTYTNCTFDGPFRIGRDGATFINCDFVNLGNDYVWNYGNDCTFIDCTFESDGKALLLYNDGGDEVAKVTVENCVFNATQSAKAGAIANQNCAAIEIDNYGHGVDLTTSGNTIDSDFSGEWRIKSHNGTANDVFVNGVEYTTLAIDGKLMTKDSQNNVTVID